MVMFMCGLCTCFGCFFTYAVWNGFLYSSLDEGIDAGKNILLEESGS